MARSAVLLLTLGLLSGCWRSEPGDSRAEPRPTPEVLLEQSNEPTAGWCSTCQGPLRSVPLRRESATDHRAKEHLRGEALQVGDDGESTFPDPAVVCDVCRHFRVDGAEEWRTLPEDFRSIEAGQQRNDNDLGLTLSWCPPGVFRMGSPDEERGRKRDEAPVWVTLSRGFWIGTFEVTQQQWQQLMDDTLREQRAKDPGQPRPLGDGSTREHVGEGPEYPIYFVSHKEAEEFCRRLTELERAAGRLEPGWEYQLPTEAQWEYACRAGTTTATPYGDRLTSEDANFDGTQPYENIPRRHLEELGRSLPDETLKGPYLAETTPVGSYRANAWGLHDMIGNVWEWCRDGYESLMVGGVNPTGPFSDERRVYRGGCWHNPGSFCRSANRSQGTPDQRGSGLGFRVALVAQEPDGT